MSVKRLHLLLLLILAVVLAGGIGLLFNLRFESGDNYPPYSTLRSDPLGARALYDSLRALPALSASQNLRPLRHLDEGAGATLFFLGFDPDSYASLSQDDSRSLETFLLEGGRLVITLRPTATRPSSTFHTLPLSSNPPSSGTLAPVKSPAAKSIRKAEADEVARQKAEKDSAPQANPAVRKAQNNSLAPPPAVSLASRLDLEFAFDPLAPDPNTRVYQPATVNRVATDSLSMTLPSTLRWRSGVTINRMGPSWRTLYSRGGNPVMVDCAYGRGSIVLATDSFFASNEALRDERQSTLLAWLVGPSPRVIFDETHLDVSETPGVVGLALQYRLHGVLIVLLVLALLFIWKNATRLVPPVADAAADSGGTGRDAWAGLVDLLERNFGRDHILRVCLMEWQRSRDTSRATTALDERLAETVRQQDDLPPRSRDPVAAYREISRLLSRRRPR